jgi:hypothetical protein
MKNLGNLFGKALCGLALALLMAGCADILNSPTAPEAKPGKAVLTVSSGPARTVSPDIGQFAKITLTITGKGDSMDLADVNINPSDGSATVSFPIAGSWDITANAYISVDAAPAARSNPHEFSWGGGVTDITGDRVFILKPTGTGNGTLRFTITVLDEVDLDESDSRIQIKDADGNSVFDVTGEDEDDALTMIENGVEGLLELAAGLYTVDILLGEDETGHTAVWRESVVILSGLNTEFSFVPGAGSFLDPKLRAALTDITDGTLQFGGTALNLSEAVITTDFQDPAAPALHIAVPAGEAVYFTLAKTAEHSVVVGEGDDAEDVNILDESAEESTPSDALVVFKVDTQDLAEDGGTKSFTLAITRQGMTGVVVAVTLDMKSPPMPAGLYIDTGTGGSEILATQEGFVYEGASTGLLQAALDWLAKNAANDTKYVILVDGNNEISTPWVSKTGSSGVQITLRGLEEERVIYWHVTPDNGLEAHLFTINGGTTLVLGENMNVGPSSTYPVYTDAFPPQTKDVFRVEANGVFEMLPGSKISGVTDHVLVNVQAGAFMMRGGSIEDNLFVGNFVGASLINSYGTGSKFEMFEGAEIKDNKHPFAQNGIPGSANNNNSIRGIAFSVTSNEIIATVKMWDGQFIMHGGSIKNNDVRGLFIMSASSGAYAEPVVFTMEGGEISGNGTGVFVCEGNSYYVSGAGIFASGSIKITMTGGSIRNNGHANSFGGAMYLSHSANIATVPVPVLIDGSVNFANNAIALAPWTRVDPGLVLGSSFANVDSSPIALEVGWFSTSVSVTDILSWFNAKIILKTPVENGVVIANVKDQFGLKLYFGNTSSNTVSFFPDDPIEWEIDDDGRLSVSLAQ